MSDEGTRSGSDRNPLDEFLGRLIEGLGDVAGPGGRSSEGRGTGGSGLFGSDGPFGASGPFGGGGLGGGLGDLLADAFGGDRDEQDRDDDAPRGTSGTSGGPTRAARTPKLDRFGRDLTAMAREGRLDPVIGRDREVAQVLEVLSRRTKNNPVLVGDPGVGKTAIVEGIAARIVEGRVPAALAGRRVVSLDLAAMVAGTKYRGEFEQRLRTVIDEVTAADRMVVLFLDELHTVVGAGAGVEGTMDAADILKPALARGDLQVVGATTLTEYRRHVESDAALERRFAPVAVPEPSVDETVAVLDGLRPRYEEHHGVRVTDEAVRAAAELSARHVHDRFLPDKAIDALDTAAARVRMRHTDGDPTPSATESVTRQPEPEPAAPAPDPAERAAEAARRVERLTREQLAAVEVEDYERAATLRTEIETARRERDDPTAVPPGPATTTPHAEDTTGGDTTGGDTTGGGTTGGDTTGGDTTGGDATGGRHTRGGATRGDTTDSRATGSRATGSRATGSRTTGSRTTDDQPNDDRSARPVVTAADVAAVIADSTGIPVAHLTDTERDRLLQLADHLGRRVVGQDEAREAVADAVLAGRAGMAHPGRPVGSFLFAGPTGVGKTELARALAESLFGSDERIVRLDMSEFREAHTVSRLTGAPPGYVGHDHPGELTDAVRRTPYCVVLFDEIEKAHPDVLNMLLGVLDAGRLTDAKGRTVSFTDAVVIMTSNVGAAELSPGRDPEEARPAVMKALGRVLKPEFLGRIDETVLFGGLDRDALRRIVDLLLAGTRERLAAQDMTMTITPAAVDGLVDRGHDPALGARPLRRVVARELDRALSRRIVAGALRPGQTVVVDETDGRLTFEVTGR